MTHMPSPEVRRSQDQRLFWRYFVATTSSSLGSKVTLVALPIVAITVLESSAFQVSLLTAASWIGWLVLGMPAGVIAHRYPLRALQVSMDATRAIALASLPLAALIYHLTYLHLILVALIVGLCNVIFDVANAAFLPTIVSANELTARNSLISGTSAATHTGGPSLGGILVQALGPVLAVVVDVLSYVLSAAILVRMPYRAQPSMAAGAKWTRLIQDGWTFVRKHKVMFPSMLWATAINCTCGALIAITPLYLVRQANVSIAFVGLLIAAEGVGSVLGAMVTTRLATKFGTAHSLLVASLVGALFAMLMPLTTDKSNIAFFALGNAGFGAGVVVGSIVTRTYRQIASPPELLSRTMATVRFVSWGATPIGAILAGILASTVGLTAAMWTISLSAFAGPLVVLFSPLRCNRDFESIPL